MTNPKLRNQWLKLCERSWSELNAQQLVELTARMQYFLSEQERRKARPLLQFPEKPSGADVGKTGVLARLGPRKPSADSGAAAYTDQSEE